MTGEGSEGVLTGSNCISAYGSLEFGREGWEGGI